MYFLLNFFIYNKNLLDLLYYYISYRLRFLIHHRLNPILNTLLSLFIKNTRITYGFFFIDFFLIKKVFCRLYYIKETLVKLIQGTIVLFFGLCIFTTILLTLQWNCWLDAEPIIMRSCDRQMVDLKMRQSPELWWAHSSSGMILPTPQQEPYPLSSTFHH